MTSLALKLWLSMFWVVLVVAGGLLGNASSPGQWLPLIGLAVGPPMIVLYFWRDPVRSTSEAIQESLR